MKKIVIFTMAVLLLLATSAQADLVALWHLDGNADDSANGYNGTENGDATYTTDGGGMFSEALSVDGAGYVNCGDISSGDWTDLTTEAWVWWDGTVVSGYAGVYFKAYGGNADTGRLLINGAGTILVQNGNGNFFSNSGVVPKEQWCHIVYKYDQSAGTESIYVNGANAGDKSRTGDITGNGYDFWIGYGWWSSLYYPFSGLIDEVRIWDEALSDTDIAASASLADVEITKSLISIFPFIDVTEPIGDLPDLNLDGYPLVPMATPITCEMEVTVSNGSSLDLSSVLVQDRMGAEWGLDSDYSGDPSILTDTKGNSEKVFIDWMIGSLLTTDPSVTLGIEATTDINPGNPGGKNKDKIHQEYTSPGVYEVNSASLGFCVTIADEEICLVKTADSIWVEAVGTDD